MSVQMQVEKWDRKDGNGCYEVQLKVQAKDLEVVLPQTIACLDVLKPDGTYARFWLSIGLNNQGQATAQLTARCGDKDTHRKARALWNKPN
jgi:hypothetical protein